MYSKNEAILDFKKKKKKKYKMTKKKKFFFPKIELGDFFFFQKVETDQHDASRLSIQPIYTTNK